MDSLRLSYFADLAHSAAMFASLEDHIDASTRNTVADNSSRKLTRWMRTARDGELNVAGMLPTPPAALANLTNISTTESPRIADNYARRRGQPEQAVGR